MKRRRISLILLLALLMSLAAPLAGAADTEPCLSGSVYNPMYASVPAPAETESEPLAEDWNQAETREAVYVTPRQAAEQLRQAMTARQTSVTLYVETADYWVTNGQVNWFTRELFPQAYSQALAEGPYDGDYLRWSWYKYNWSLLSADGNRYAFRVELEYYTTAEEEQWLAREVARLAEEMGLTAKTPYDAYTAIYDYITEYVEYDYAGLETISDGITGNEDYDIFTAYGALKDGEAVCQGYAALYYALCRQADLPVRIITSANHAWNIVYLKDIWYNVDATWDAGTAGGRDWYLLGSGSFDGGSHSSEAEYCTEEFRNSYPICDFDFDPDMPFNDVPKTNGQYDNIRRAAELKLFNGTTAYTFSPGMEISRAMLVTVLWRLEGSPEGAAESVFTDVPRDMYYAQAVDWAAENGIVNGMGGTEFAPYGAATREQLVTVLYRYARYLQKDTSASAPLDQYTDRNHVGAFAVAPMEWAVGTGLVKGVTTTTLCPQNNTPREQLAALLVRLIDYYGL